MIEIYCDGSAAPNPGKGGFGVVVMKDNKVIDIISRYKELTTNNEQELLGMKAAIEYVDEFHREEKVIIYCDSAYVVNICNEWIYGWANKGWRRKGGEILNLEIIKEIYKLLVDDTFKSNYVIKKVSGHAGVDGNEFADALATWNTSKILKLISKLDCSESVLDTINKKFECEKT